MNAYTDTEDGPAVPAAEERSLELQAAHAPAGVGALVGGLLAGGLAFGAGTPVESALLTFLTLLAAGALVGRRPTWMPLLPMMGLVARLSGPVFGVAALALLHQATTLPDLDALGFVYVAVAADAATFASERLMRRSRRPQRQLRIAVIGSSSAADMLARELHEGDFDGLRIVGRIDAGATADEPGDITCLGPLADLGSCVAEHRIDLLLMTAGAPRLAVFDEISRSCLHLPVRLQELASFYEDTFGHVPVGEINASWFQYIMHPRFRSGSPVLQRVLDLAVASVALVLLSPVILVLMLLIRRDGGPALFRQRRIGEGGRPFTIFKLRTMHQGASDEWADANDVRVTGIGRLLRRSHLDELPQLVQVLRGEMSLVGPRPEQPAFVDRLEQTVPFYSRRHLVKPGLTGWAQVRCGYAGSDVGSAWKVSHDLFYLKHRSVWMNLVILGETLRTLVADRQYSAEPRTVAFILRPAAPQAPVPAAKAQQREADATTAEWLAAATLPSDG